MMISSAPMAIIVPALEHLNGARTVSSEQNSRSKVMMRDGASTSPPSVKMTKSSFFVVPMATNWS